MNWWERYRLVICLFGASFGVMLFLLLGVRLIYQPENFLSWSTSGWIFFALSIALAATYCGALLLPSGIVSLVTEKDDLKEMDNQLKSIKVLVNGREIRLGKTELPQQMKLYFASRGEYPIQVKCNFKDSSMSPYIFKGSINLYDCPAASEEIKISFSEKVKENK
jgi:hypothetical protein